jgi:hypothetical protein
MDELREKLASALVAEIERQSGGNWPRDMRGLIGVIDDYIDFAELADSAIAAIHQKEQGTNV